MLDPMAAPKKPVAPLEFIPDDKQREAIEHVQGPMLVIAGAGTGKTSVLVNRIASLIREGHAHPNEILALTYTDNAAGEMRARVKAAVKDLDVSKLQALTFHAYCNGLLYRTGKQFGVLDDKDLWIFLRRRIRELHLQHFVRAANVGLFLTDLLDFFRRCQDELVTPEQYQNYVDRICRKEMQLPRVAKSKDALPEEEALERCREIAGVFSTTEKWLAERNLGTFGHMITKAHDLLYRDAALLEEERRRFRFILVDEFQDANYAQIRILSALAGETKNVFAVGDPDQAIYRFRGASSAAFTLFHRMFPATRIVVLGNNRRSRTPILECAFSVIAKNPGSFTGEAKQLIYKRAPLVSVRDQADSSHGFPAAASVQLATWSEKELEAADLVNELRNRRRQLRCPWSSCAVLYRNHSNRDELVKELVQNSIPFTIENMDVLDTSDVRDLLACLGATFSLADSASLFRVAALPRFEINGQELRTAMKAAGRDAMLVSVMPNVEHGNTVLDTLRAAKSSSDRTNPKIRAALEIVARHFAIDLSTPSIQALLDFTSMWEKKATTETGEPGEFLDYLEYFAEAGGSVPLSSRDDDSVRLMTAHAAKGLEFEHVFILRAAKPSFPNSYREPLVAFPRELRSPDSLSEDDSSTLCEQEERRLFYVAMTRARETLTIYGKNGKGRNDPTPPGFIRELLADNSTSAWRNNRPARPLQTDLFAGEEEIVLASSNASSWFSMPPQEKLVAQLSASAIDIYERCPLRFKLERDWRIPREVPAALHYGSAMHRALLAYYDAVRLNREISDAAVLDVFRTLLAEAAIQDRYQHDLYLRQGIEQLTAFLESARHAPSPQVLATEASFTIEIGDATIRGRIDRMDRLPDDTVAIVDYKTGKPRSQKDADESLQLSIYALAAQMNWKKSVGRVAFHNLEDNSLIDTVRNSFELEEARSKVEAVTAAIGEGKFPAKPGFQCGSCPYRNLCPATEKSFTLVEATVAAVARNN